MGQAVKYYDFNLSAGASQVILAVGSYFRIQTATGALDVTVENIGTLPGLLQGQGFKETPFQRLVLKDVSGASNSGTILIAASEFIDNRTYGVTTLSNQQGVFTQASATVTNASSQVSTAKPARRYLLIQNKDAAGNIWVNLAGAAATTANGILIAAGGSIELSTYAPTSAINVIGDIASNANVLIVEG